MRKTISIPLDVYLLYSDIKRELRRATGRDVPWGVLFSAVYIALKRRCSDIASCVAEVLREEEEEGVG